MPLIPDISISEYLDIVNSKKFRIVLTKLRVSSHRLEIEIGRWPRSEKNEFDNRKCKLCNNLENEFHFVFKYPL